MSMEPTESSIETLFEEPYMEVTTFATLQVNEVSGPGHGGGEGGTDPGDGDDGDLPLD